MDNAASFAVLLARYRRQSEHLEAAADERDIDQLADSSHATLVELSRTRAATPTDMAAKIDAVLGRQSNFGVVPIAFVCEMLSDAEALAATAAASTNLGGMVEAAWAEWKAGMLAVDGAAQGDVENAESPLWHRIKAAQNIIATSIETGPRVAEIRLWMAMTSDLILASEHEAIHREDVDWLIANADEPEFASTMALAAIKALRGEVRS